MGLPTDRALMRELVVELNHIVQDVLHFPAIQARR